MLLIFLTCSLSCKINEKIYVEPVDLKRKYTLCRNEIVDYLKLKMQINLDENDVFIYDRLFLPKGSFVPAPNEGKLVDYYSDTDSMVTEVSWIYGL